MKYLFLLALTISFHTLASTGGGNGGISVVCRGPEGKITSAELLEIYEGRTLYKKVYDNSLGDMSTMMAMVEDQLGQNPVYLKRYQQELGLIHKNIIFVPKGHKIELTEDALPVISQVGCSLEQLANYTQSGTVLISQEIFDNLDNLNKAALYVHEAVYAVRRQAGDTTSVRTRKLVKELTALNPDKSMVASEISQTYDQLCPLQEYLGLNKRMFQEDYKNLMEREDAFISGIRTWRTGSQSIVQCREAKKKKQIESSCLAALQEWNSLIMILNSLTASTASRIESMFIGYNSEATNLFNKYGNTCSWNVLLNEEIIDVRTVRSIFVDSVNSMLLDQHEEVDHCKTLYGLGSYKQSVECLIKTSDETISKLNRNPYKSSYLDALSLLPKN